MIKQFALWLRDMFIRNRSLNATRIVAASFAVIILVGALLLTLPIASRDGQSAGFFTALFTATSSTCVTGLILVDTWVQWSFFGQLVIILMIQLGGLGFMTVITLVSFALRRRIGLSERLIMVSTLNLNDLDGVVRMVRHALMGTFLIEGTGAVLLSIAMIPHFGILGGIWRGIFHSISAFCNAGFDLLGGKFGAFSSLAGLQNNPLVLGTIGALIVVGGLGFFCVGGYPGKALLAQTFGVQQNGAYRYRSADYRRRAVLPGGGILQSRHPGEYASVGEDHELHLPVHYPAYRRL